MNKIYIFDPSSKDSLSAFRGGGRIIQILKENLTDKVEFISDVNNIDFNSTLLVPFWNPFSPPFLTKRMAKKQILMIFDVIPLKYPQHFPIGLKGSLNLWRNKQALKNYDHIITISESSKKDISQYLKIPADDISVVYPTISNIFLNNSPAIANHLDVTSGERGNLKDKTYFLYVGDVNWNKNLVNLAKAIKLADVKCVFVGKAFIDPLTPHHPWQQEFKEFLIEIQNDPRFIFPGYVPDEQLVDYYRHASANLLVSRDEGFGFSYFEASSQGCPSILSDIPVFREVAGKAALFAHHEDPQDIARKIEDSKIRQKNNIDNNRFSKELFQKKIISLLN